MRELISAPRPPGNLDVCELLADNQSKEATRGLKTWRRAKDRGALVGVHTCGDARVVPTSIFCTPTIIEIASIAAASSVEPFSYAMRHSGVMASIVLGHFALDSIIKKGYAEGCGGLHERSHLSSVEQDPEGDSVEKYILDNVASPDVAIQTIISATQMC